ncbi:hypothetical protein VTO42DRAFT_5141 [Malbranchea cinnamomea]
MATASLPAGGPTGKASAAPPKLSTTHKGDVELEDMKNGGSGSNNGSGSGDSANDTPLPVEKDIMQLARLGEVNAIRKLFESGKYDAKYCDEEGITPLHWAAINNRYELCKFLLDSGAEVDAKGGESVATPAMWAAQRCHYYIVNLLLQYGADPLLTDSQGYNILHLATIDGNAYLLALLLHQGIPVDVTDPQGHTGLMWAAYKGYPACVELFLRWGANVNATDEGGLTPLHWALVKGSTACIHKIIEYGADRFAKTSDGKTPAVVAEEMRSTYQWYRALSECGYDRNGNAIVLPLGLGGVLRDKWIMSKFYFFWPFFMIFAVAYILSYFSIYAGVPLAIAALALMQFATGWVARKGPTEYRILQRTPFLAGVFAGSLFWVGVRWLTRVLPETYSSHPFLNGSFGVSFVLTTYFYFLSMMEDPGFVPKLSSRNEQREVIAELFSLWKFDEDNFCIVCMIRKPLRSKHCRRCKRCVAKHDHHCPWIDNCVGVNNLRHFILYIFSMEIGICIFIHLVIVYIESLPPASTECNLLSETLCGRINRDSFTIIITVWIALQLIWVTMLCVVQLVQISRNQTTYENMKGQSIDYLHPSAQAIASALMTGTTSLDATGQGPNPSIPPPRARHHHNGCCSQWKKLFGLDSFFATAQGGLLDRRHASRPRNPFSRGIVTNCRDFWCDPAPYFGRKESGLAMLDGEIVNYNQMYEVPLRLRGERRTGGGILYTSIATEERELGG